MTRKDQHKLLTARRLVSLAAVCAALFLAGTLTVFGAPKADFSLAATPATQSVTAGGTATYALSISRTGGFTAPVALTVSGLPAGAKASFNPAGPITGTTTTLTVTTTAGASPTPAGAYDLTVSGTASGLAHTTSVRLTVQAQQAFALSISPSTRSISQDDETTYDVALQRTGGFTGAVALSVAGLPKGTTATVSPATIPAGATTAQLKVAAAANAGTGSFSLSVKGASGSTTATATAVLNVGTKQDFTIAGDAVAPVVPGTSAPIELRVSNPNNFPIRITGIDVAVATATSRAGCSGTTEFTTAPFTGPVDIPANAAAVPLSSLVGATRLPRIAMRNRAANQDACKGARLTLRYSGTAVKA